MKKAPYCPRNGCFMVNGAAPICSVNCPKCGTRYALTSKLCPTCHTCHYCERIGKRFYQFEK